MQKINNIFERMSSRQNLYQAVNAASLGKLAKKDVAAFIFFLEKNVANLHEELRAGRYCPGNYKMIKIFEPKEREICVAPFRDRVVHHAVHDVIEPMIDRVFIFDSYACRRGKGTHQALDRAQSFLRANRFCLHGDIRKCFPSIDCMILKKLLRRFIADEKVLALIDLIIDSYSGQQECSGLPIGNLTSQFFANLYLHELDFYVKHHLQCQYYLRYMDDFLVFDHDSGRLQEVRFQIKDFLASRLRLDLHSGKTQIYQSARGITFLGFRLFKDYRRMSTVGLNRLRKRINLFRSLAQQGLMDQKAAPISIACWSAHSRYAQTRRLRQCLAGEVRAWSPLLADQFVW